LFWLGLTFAVSGCGASDPSPAPKPSIEKKVELEVQFVVWNSRNGETGNCKSGLDAADFLKDDATVRVYDNSNGVLLNQGNLEVSSGYKLSCIYSLSDLVVPEVNTYRTVIDGRYTDISTQVDLRVSSQELQAELGFSIGTLVLVDEFGVPPY
jgi:hypothetical protein